MVKVNKVGHVVLNCRDVEASMKFYTEALGMEVVSYRPDRPAAFLSFGTQHHDIALFQGPTDADMLEPEHLGLNHIALQIEGGEEELKELYQNLKAHGAKIDRLSDHGMTRSVYFFDPDGNRLEVFCEMMEPAEGKKWMGENSGVRRPLVLEEASS